MLGEYEQRPHYCKMGNKKRSVHTALGKNEIFAPSTGLLGAKFSQNKCSLSLSGYFLTFPPKNRQKQMSSISHQFGFNSWSVFPCVKIWWRKKKNINIRCVESHLESKVLLGEHCQYSPRQDVLPDILPRECTGDK